MGEPLHVVDIGGDVAEHTLVVSIVDNIADVGNTVAVEDLLALDVNIVILRLPI